ncbi:TIGR03084 family metal-binding protein [Streptomyces sp. NPDC054796]
MTGTVGTGAAGAVLTDLRDEGDELEALVAGLEAKAWALPTPAPNWTVAHQIAHLTWTDGQSLTAATDEAAFQREVEKAMAAPDRFVDEGAEEGAALVPGELLEHWREGRSALLRTLADQPEGRRIPWYGPPMSVAGMATARLMETWAHGEDVADALGVRRARTVRLRHVARIGVRARDFAYAAHGLTPPAAPFRVELTGTDGEPWVYGPEDAAERVTGDAVEFCLLVTQRVHRDDTGLRAEGAEAGRWLDIAQAFAGPPGAGRAPGAGAGAGPAAGPEGESA